MSVVFSMCQSVRFFLLLHREERKRSTRYGTYNTSTRVSMLSWDLGPPHPHSRAKWHHPLYIFLLFVFITRQHSIDGAGAQIIRRQHRNFGTPYTIHAVRERFFCFLGIFRIFFNADLDTRIRI